MSAKHALLGLLLKGPAYPYELADRLEQVLGPAWTVNSGQVYQAVAGLEHDGLIEPVEPSRRNRKDRHVFAITNAGVDEFESWFGSATERVRLPRRPLLVKITLGGPARLEHALEELDAYEAGCSACLQELTSQMDAVKIDSGPLRADLVLLRMNIRADILHLEAELTWTAQARETVVWLLGQEAVWPRERALETIRRHDAHQHQPERRSA